MSQGGWGQPPQGGGGQWGPGQPPQGAPPGAPGGFGPPPGAPYGNMPGPYPQGGFQPGPPAVTGSLPLGFLAGFFGGCIGLILVHLIAKGPETKKGANIGFVVGLAVGAIIRVAASR